jgi:chromate transporter
VGPFGFFVVVLRASLLSVGGQTGLPLLRDGLVPAGLVTDGQIVEALTIGRLSTGPGGLYVVSLGYLALGWVGAIVGLVAITIPPVLVIPASSFVRTRLDVPWMAGAIKGLALGGSGLVIATSLQLAVTANAGAAPAWWQIALVVLGFAAALEGKRHPALVIAVGALVGILLR